jgi:hypothetical protein
MWWLVRRDREQFTGCIAGLGTASGHRVVIGHWARSPYGAVTDVMVEDPVGHRTLYAPTRQLAAFLTASYRFDQVQVVPCRARRSGPDWTVQAGPLQVSFTTGRRNLLGWLLWAIPMPWPEAHGGWGCWTFPPAGCCQGSAPVAVPRTDVASGTGLTTCGPSSPSTPPSTVTAWARCERSDHRSASASARYRAGRHWST